jgi:cytochrome c
MTVIGTSRVALGAMALATGLAVAQGGPQDPQTLLEHYKCNSCHAEREARTGPAFVDVASRYRSDPNAVATLTAAIKRGAHGTGPWHMPPHPELSDKDARTIIGYILSLRPPKGGLP